MYLINFILLNVQQLIQSIAVAISYFSNKKKRKTTLFILTSDNKKKINQ
jgi:hypothetical protein